MASRNDVTGDNLISKTSNDNYRNNWDRIFGNKDKKEEDKKEDKKDS